MSEQITASAEKPTLRIISKIALLFVVIGFFMPVCHNQTGFNLACNILKLGDINSVVIMQFIVLLVFFIATLISILLLIPLFMNKKVHFGFDLGALIVSILCFVFFILKFKDPSFAYRALTGQNFDIQILNFLKSFVVDITLIGEGLNIQMGGQYILMGLTFSLLTLAISLIPFSLNAKTLIKNNIRNYSMFIILILILLMFGPLCGWTNFEGRNITYIFFQFSYVFILATGMVQCIIICGIDLSVGSVVAFVGAISVMIYNTGVGMIVTLLASLIMGLAVGAFQGWFIAYPKIPPFIATLAGMLLFRGLTYIVTNVSPVNPKDDVYSYFSTGTIDYDLLHMEDPVIFGYRPTPFIFALIIIAILWVVEFRNRKTRIAHDHDVSPLAVTFVKLALMSILLLILAERFASYLGLPIIVIVLLVTIGLFHFIMKNTVLGRYIYAVGGNERSAKLSGINTELVTFVVYCIMGVLTGLAAVVSTGYMNSALPQAGNMFEMDAIAACYIGGVSATGGIGTVVGVVVGGLIMSAINNGMTLMNLGAHYQYVVKALVVLLAVFYDVYSRRKAGLG